MAHRRRGVSIRLAVALAAALLLAAGAAKAETETIALTGDSAPGTGGGTFWLYFSNPALNASGQAAFQATLTGTTDGSFYGIFRGDGSTTTAIARDKWSAPGAGGGRFEGFLSDPALNASGQVAFQPWLTGTTDGSSEGIFRSDGSTTTAIARETWAAPGTGGGTFANSSFPAFNASGQAAFQAWLTGTTDGSTSGLFRGDGSTTTAIAREKWAATGTGGGTFVNFGWPALNASGQAAFYATLTGTTDGSTRGIFRGDGSTTTAIAREKWAAPGTGGGTFELYFSYPALNASGQAAFQASLTGTTDGSTWGIFRGDGSTTTAIAREKWAAPGTGGGTFADCGYFALNASGQAAFRAELTSTVGGMADNVGIFLADDQERIVVVRKGDALEGSSVTGVALQGDPDPSRSGLNDYGQVAYSATLADERHGVFLFTPELHWRAGGSGSWDTATNWTVGLAPASVHPVLIDPSSSLTVTGPAYAKTVKSLTVGAQTLDQTAALSLSSPTGTLSVTGAATIKATGRVDVGAGTLTAASLTNAGTLTVGIPGSVTLGAFTNWGTATISGAAAVSGAVENNGCLTVQSGGTLTATGGLTNLGNLTLDAATLAGGTVTNDYGASMCARGRITGTFTNNGSLSLAGRLTTSGLVTNFGTVWACTAQNLRQNGGLDNYGTVALSGGAVSGSGTVINMAGGIVRGYGAVSAAATNVGLVYADSYAMTLTLTSLSANTGNGELRIADNACLNALAALANSGQIDLGGADAVLSGGTVTNTGTIRGQGRVANSVTNSAGGSVRAEGGLLALGGATTNAAGALLEIMNDATLLVSQGLMTNSGSVILRGGSFDNNGHTMANASSITGYGTLRTGGLTNNVDKNIGVGGGDLDVLGTVQNSGTWTTQAGCTTTFYNAVSGLGGFPGTGTVTFLDGYSPGSSPGAVSFGGDVVFGPSAALEAELGGTAPGAHDALHVADTVTLGGTLAVDCIDPYRPSHNDTFQLMTFASRGGTTFGEHQGLDLGDRLALTPTYSATDLVLTAVQGGPGEWAVDADGDASVPANWSAGLPNGAGDVATFGSVITAPREVTVDGPTTLGAMRFNNPQPYALAGPGPLTLDALAGEAAIDVTGTGGTHVIGAGVLLADALDIDVAALGTLVLEGLLDNSAGRTITKMGDGTLVIDGPQAHASGTVFEVLGGTVDLNTATGGPGTADVSILVDGAVLHFGCDQHLDTLALSNDALVQFTGANVVVVKHLVMDGIDLGAMTLTPEPATLLLLAAGLGALVLRKRRT